MSIKVLIVDDEKLERVLIHNGYHWEENGFEIIGEAVSGEEALEFIERRKPDIVFTDINMPHMDGLELTERIRQLQPGLKVVIVTGYREFEYARQAVRLGVEDFLLKPVNLKDIDETVMKIKQDLMKEKAEYREMNELKELKESVTADHDIVKESFLQRLVENRIGEEEALRRLSMYCYESVLEGCICINIKPRADSDEERLEAAKRIQQLVNGNRYDKAFNFLHYMHKVLVYFMSGDLRQVFNLAGELHAQIGKKLNLETDIGISNEARGFPGIRRAYKESEEAISASVILGRNRCILYEEYEKIKKQHKEKIELNWDDFIFSIQNCLVEKAEGYIDEYVDMIKQAGITDMEYLKLMAMNILSKAGAALSKYGMGLNDITGEEDFYERVAAFTTVEEIHQYLRSVIHKIMEYHDKVRQKKGNKVVEQAVAYIEENLSDSLLSLRTVAARVYTNESYLSRVFKQEIGESMISYITRRRIEQSIVLLNTTDLKVYEIAEQVGIKDSHYFSICFKKQMGITVKEYKKPKY